MRNIVRIFLLGNIISSVLFAKEYNCSQSAEINLQVVQKLLDYGDKKVVAHMNEFFADTVCVHNRFHPEGKEYSLQEIIHAESERIEALLGKKWEVLDRFVMENLIISYMRMQGVHLGNFMGLSATEKEFSTPVVFIYRFDNGKICEVWNSWDRLHVIHQLGEVHITSNPNSNGLIFLEVK